MSAESPSDAHSLIRGRWAVGAMFFVNGFLMGSWAPQIPFMLPRHGISEFALGLLILLFGAGAVAAMTSVGGFIAGRGSREVTAWTACVACIALSLVVFAPNVASAAPALLLMGASTGTMDVAMNANAVELEKRLGRAIMSASHGFWSLGGLIGGAVGGPVIVAYGVHAHAAATTVLMLVVVAISAPRLINEAAHDADAEVKSKFAWPRSPAILIIGVMALFSMIPEGAVLDWSALYLGKELHSDVRASGFGFALFSGAMALMRFLGDGLRNRFGAVTTMRVSGVIAAGGMLAAGFAPNAALAIAAFGVAGLGIANMVPIAFSAAGNQPGLSPGAGIAPATMLGYSGALAAPSAIGFVAEHIGFRITYLTLAGLLVVVAALAGKVASADRAG